MKTFSFIVLFMAARLCVGATQIQDALAKPVSFFSQDSEPIGAVLQSLGRANGISIVADPDVTGNVSVEMNNTTVQGVLEAILNPNGFFYEEESGWISVQSTKTVLYTFDYPQVSRSGHSSSQISLGGSSSNGGSNSSGQNGMNFVGAGSGALSQAVNGNSSGQSGNGGDTTQISISQKNEADFWSSIEAQIRSMLSKNGQLVIDRFSGITEVRDNMRVHKAVKNFVDRVNTRIGAQVEISAKIIEVTFNDQKATGIDWNVAAFKVGGLSVGGQTTAPSDGAIIKGLTSGTTINSVNGFVLAQPTIAGAISSGTVTAVIRALSQQGKVNVTNSPRIRLLNNQSGFIKDAIDQPFFSLSSNVTINAGGTAIGGAQPITQLQYTEKTISIGLVVPITAQISDDDIVTMDITPVLTRLIDIARSPDNTQTSAVLDVKQTATIVRLRSGESAVIGGLVTDSDALTKRKIPLLGDLPGIGRAFRSDGRDKSRSELVILLTPTVIRYSSAPILAAAIVAPAPVAEVSKVEGISVP